MNLQWEISYLNILGRAEIRYSYVMGLVVGARIDIIMSKHFRAIFNIAQLSEAKLTLSSSELVLECLKSTYTESYLLLL